MIQALIMAGGSSERMRASGVPVHKAIREVAGRTLLHHNIDYLRSHGINDITLAVNQREKDLISHAALLPLIVETKPLGTIGSVRLFERAATLLVLYVDNLTDLDLTALVRFHHQQDAAMTVASHDEPFRIPFGELEIKEGRVMAYKEKPTFPVPISSGLYVLSSSAIAAIEPGERIHAPDLVNRLIASGQHVAAFRHQAWWVDVNDETALAKAEEAMARSLTGPEFHL